MLKNVNDNDVERPTAQAPEPDAHGQAALLLAESLIHGLVAREVLSVADAVEISEIAAEVRAEIAIDCGEPTDTLCRSRSLLEAIGDSLKHDA